MMTWTHGLDEGLRVEYLDDVSALLPHTVLWARDACLRVAPLGPTPPSAGPRGGRAGRGLLGPAARPAVAAPVGVDARVLAFPTDVLCRNLLYGLYHTQLAKLLQKRKKGLEPPQKVNSSKGSTEASLPLNNIKNNQKKKDQIQADVDFDARSTSKFPKQEEDRGGEGIPVISQLLNPANSLEPKSPQKLWRWLHSRRIPQSSMKRIPN